MMVKFRHFLLAVFCTVCFVSCNDEEETESNYLSGTIKISMKAYVAPGYTKSFQVDTLSTLSRPDGVGIGYYFRATDFAVLDTVKRMNETVARPFTFTVPDSLGSFTLQVSGFSTDYVSSSATTTFTVVKPGHQEGSSITGFEILPTDQTFTDPRDNKVYFTFKVGNTLWFRENLAWSGSGVPFQTCDIMSTVLGRFYSYREAMNACPSGWRLPRESDWLALASSLGTQAEAYSNINGVAGKMMENVYFNGNVMWPFERYVRITNNARFSAIPSGYAIFTDNGITYKDIYSYAVFWTAEEQDGYAICRYIYKEQDDLMCDAFDSNSFLASVRCVKDL